MSDTETLFNDLVGTLRECHPPTQIDYDMCQEAANEIERLSTENSRLRTWLVNEYVASGDTLREATRKVEAVSGKQK